MFGEYADVMEAVDEAQAQDPEQEMWGELLEAWYAMYGHKAQTCADVMRDVQSAAFAGPNSSSARLAEALEEYRGHRPLSARSLGKALQYRTGRLVNGKRMRRVETGGKHSNLWQVEAI